MEDEARTPKHADPTDDPHDEIVGTITLPSFAAPSWLDRISAGAWLFIGLAAFDAVVQIRDEFLREPGEPTSTGLVFRLASIVLGSATVLLPAAVLIGRWGVGRAESWLLQGTIALAAAELVRLIGPGVVSTLAGPPSTDGESTIFGIAVRSLVVVIPTLILILLGLAKIGLGLGALDAIVGQRNRGVVVVCVASLVVFGLGEVVLFWGLMAAIPGDAVRLGIALIILLVGLMILGSWSWIATISARRTGSQWPIVTMGSLAIVVSFAFTAARTLAAEGGLDGPAAVRTASALADVALHALGVVLLVVGFARGFEPIDDEDGSEAGSDGLTESEP